MSAPGSIFGIVAFTVSDLDRTTAFYRNAFGFRALETTSPDGGALGVTARFIEKDGVVLEIVVFAQPLPPGQAERPMAALGALSHLAFNVEDLAATEVAVKAAGGTVVEESRMNIVLDSLGPAEIVYARDPDGIWIEMLSVDEAKRRVYVGLDR